MHRQEGREAEIDTELEAHAVAARHSDPAAGISGTAGANDRETLRGLLVFIVEDEILVSLQLEDMLTSLGCHVLDPAQTFDEAARMLDTREFDVAVLDINLAGQVVYPIARRLADRGVPFVFTTAYSTSYVSKVWPQAPTLTKPYSETQLVRAIATAVRTARR
jgi:CheY-like chemotaxis protein